MNESAAAADGWQRYRAVMRSWLEVPEPEEPPRPDMSSLAMDQALLIGAPARDVALYSVSDDCFRCPFERLKLFPAGAETSLVVDTARWSTWRLYSGIDDTYLSSRNTTGLVCQLRPTLGEFGLYRLNVTSDGSCHVATLKEPVNIYTPLLLLLGVVVGVSLLYGIVKLILSRVRKTGKLRYGDKELAIKQRLRALDTFRGMAIVMMIFVNDGAGGYWWLQHATWNGLAAGDLVFPAFLWIMGVCIPLSVKSAFAKGEARWTVLRNVVRRSVIMFLLGVSLNTVYGSNMLQEIRVCGVLQRLAVCYLLAAGFYTLTSSKYYTPPRGACAQALKDLLSCCWCWVLGAVLVTAHCVITFIVHDPDCPAGYLGPGGRHDDWAAPNCSGGAAGYIDRLLLGDKHLYQNSQAKELYGGRNTDPEGLLGHLTATFQVVLGIQAGCTVLYQRAHAARVWRWLAGALLLALAGALLAGFSRDHGLVPINKALWSLSFVLVTSAACLALLAALYALTDVAAWRGGPLRAAGLNALALYVGHELCARLFPFHWRLPHMHTHALRLLEAAWGTMLWLLVAHVMARKKVFISL